MIATLFSVPKSETDMTFFSFANRDHHDFIISALANKGRNLTSYNLSDLPLFDIQNWLRRHQQAHTDFTSALGIQGNDLSTVDIKDPKQLSAWIWLHANEHYLAMNSLGVESPNFVGGSGGGGAGGGGGGGGGAGGIQSDSGGSIVSDTGGSGILPG